MNPLETFLTKYRLTPGEFAAKESAEKKERTLFELRSPEVCWFAGKEIKKTSQELQNTFSKNN